MEQKPSPETAAEQVAAGEKDNHINLRISTADKQEIEKKAARAGLKTGDYVRRAALGKQIVEKVPAELRQALAAIGNNLNHLVRLANAGQLNGANTAVLNELMTRLLQTLK
ncbi:plasmid mobilization protein [Hymenobacter tenuis]